MANYRQIHVKIWKDPWFLELEPEEKMLFIYLITNEQTNLAGIYEISRRVISFETCLDSKRISEIFNKFENDGKVFTERSLVWVVNMRQYHETGSDKVKQRIVSDVDNIPYCELIEKYIAYYPPPIGYIYSINTLLLKEEEEDKDIDNINESEEAAPVMIDAQQAERIFTEATGMPTFPAQSRDDDTERIIAIYSQQQKNTVEYLRKFYGEWIHNRKYSKSNTAWLDWAVANDIPKKRDNNNTNRKTTGVLARERARLEAESGNRK